MVRAKKTQFQKPILNRELSGASKRVKNKKIETENKKLAENAKKYFSSRTPQPQPQPSSSSQILEDPPPSQTVAEFSDQLQTEVITSTTESVEPPELEPGPSSGSTNEQPLDYSEVEFKAGEITSWPNPIQSHILRLLVELGPPKHTTTNFQPVNGKSFNNDYFIGQKKNRETYKRDWLVYSDTSNSLFCFPCCLFPPINQEKGISSPWVNYSGKLDTKQGYSDFNHTKRGISFHEESQIHFQSILSWKIMLNNSGIKCLSDKLMKSEEAHWRGVLKGILDAIMFLATNNLAFRGASDNLQDRNCGNFLSLIKLLAKYYPHLTSHLDRLKSHQVNYMSHSIQNEFINLCGSSVRTTVLNRIRDRKYYSIMFDSTPDISHSEQVSQIIRTVSCSKEGCQIEENFVDFISTNKKTGQDLSEVILKKLAADELDIRDCRWQGYDNGANMAGIHRGVQRWIVEQNENALFIPCSAHSLNLVGVNAAEKVLPAKLALGQIQNLFVFFSSSTSRWEILKSKVKVTLKGQSTTRWAARFDAVSALHEQYFEITEALTEMTHSESLNAETVAGASSKLTDMLNFKFMLALHIWNSILGKIQICSNSLQVRDFDLERGQNLLTGLLSWLKEFRMNGFQECYDEASVRANSFGIPTESGFEDVRVRKRKLFHDETVNVVQISNLDRFEMEFFNSLVDKLISEIETRFTQIRLVSDLFGFLWGHKLVTLTKDEQMKHVQDLCSKYSNDFDIPAFANEIQFLQDTISPFLEENEPVLELGPLAILNILYKHDLQFSFPNVETALRIFLTLPLSVATNERAFSKLKIIKTYLRSTMGQERLTNLAIISIEHEIASHINFDDIIQKFASTKCRMVKNL